VVESIPAWHYRLAGVTILNRDAFGILERIEDKKGTAIYVDPPYLVKGAKYIHDFADGDHERLAELLKRFKQSRVVVSYYAHPKLAELYPGWQRHEINVSKAMSHAGGRGEKDIRATEVLLVNDNSSAGLF
jgi:DNA adenine methylase